MRGRPSSRSSRMSQSCEDYERQDIDARPVRNEIAPVSPTGRGERRPDNLEIFGTISIGADDQRRAAFEVGMVFHFVLDAAFGARQ